MFWFLMIAVIVVSIALVFVLSLAEGAWWTVKEMEVQGTSPKIILIKKLLEQRIVVVSWILWLLDLCLFLGAFVLGLITERHSSLWVVMVVVVYTVVRFVLGEMVSKNWAYNHPLTCCLFSVRFLHVCWKYGYPVTWGLQKLNQWTGGKKRMIITEKDVLAFAETAKQQGVLHETEFRHICQLIHTGNQQLRTLMTPISQCRLIQVKTSVATLQEAFQKKCPILIVNDTGKVVIGSVSADDLANLLLIRLPKEEIINLSKAVGGCVTLPADMEIPEGWNLMRRNPVGVVRELVSGKEKGKLSGVITLLDIAQRILEVEELE